MNVTTSLIIRRIEAALWVLGLICVVAYGVSRAHSAHAQSAAISSMESQWGIQPAGQADQSLWSQQRIAQHERALAESDGLSPIALLEIPAVGIRVAVFEGTSVRVLNLGAGRVPGTGQVGASGNLALAGHRDGYFRGLKDIAVGDDISIRHANGIDIYRVTELAVVEPVDVSVLAPTESQAVTLITCFPFYFVGSAPQRFIVRADRKADENES